MMADSQLSGGDSDQNHDQPHSAQPAFWHWRPASDALHFSPDAARLLGFAPDQLPTTGRAWLACLEPEYRQQLQAILRDGHRDGRCFGLQFPWPHADGTRTRLQLEGTVATDAGMLFGTLSGIGAPDEAIPASELAAILHKYSNDGVLVVDGQGCCVQADTAAIQLLETTRERLLGQPLSELVDWSPDASGDTAPRLVRTRSGGSEATLELRPLGDAERGLHIYTLRDISERRNAEKTDALLAAIVDSSQDAIVGKNLDGIIQFWNKAAQKMFGYRAEEAIGRHITLLIPEDRLQEEDVIISRLRRGERVEHFETIRRTKSGELLNISLCISPIIDQSGQIIGASKIARDITRQKRIEAASQRSQELLTAVVEAAPVAVMLLDATGRVELWNSTAARMFGWSAEEICAPSPQLHPLLLELSRACMEDAGEDTETTVTRKDGAAVEVAVWSSDLPASEVQPARQLIIAADISDRRREQRAFQEQEQRLRTALSASRTGTFHWNIRTNALLWDENLNRVFGLQTGETVNTLAQFIERIHPEDRETALQRLQRCARQGTDLDMDLRVVWPDGTIHWLYQVGQVVVDEHGVPEHMTGACVDITVRKQTEQALRDSEEKFRTLADNIAQFAWMADGNGWIFWYNQRWFDYTGTTLEQMQGWGWRDVHHPDHVERVVEKLSNCYATGTVWEDTFPLRAADGSYRWFLSRAIPIRDAEGQVTRWFGTNTDITERRDMEEALRAADQRKDAFLATLAHELRNPLAPIVNGLELLRLSGGDSPTLQKIHATMHRQTLQLVRLVDDLLEVSRISRNKVRLRRERVELHEVIASAIETVDPLARKHQHQLHVLLPETPVTLWADPARLAQIFSNLLYNAAKYTPPGGEIRLRAEADEEMLRVQIQDNGCGIPPDMLEAIFEPFTQTSSLESGRSGLGIGLTLVRALVELHGGSVRAHSAGLNQGAEFELALPVVQHRNQVDPATPSSESDMAQFSQRILVVDDNEDAAVSTTMLLEAMGNEVRTAYDGEEALAVAADFLPHVVLLDLGMPKINGYEAARRLRSAEWGREMVLIALTGWGQEQDRQRTSDAGFDHHLVKPMDPAALRSLLEEIASDAAKPS